MTLFRSHSQPVQQLAADLALAQAAYYLPTALWPLIDDDSFQQVTGPKRDLWLVKTVCALLLAIGAALWLAGYRRRVAPESELLGFSCAASLVTVDLVYVARRRISPVYLLDALAETGLALGWLLLWARRWRSVDGGTGRATTTSESNARPE